MEIECSEHIQDYAQYIHITKQVLRYRRMKQAQLELIEETLTQKKVTLEGLLRMQDESNKLRAGMDQLSISKDNTKNDDEEEEAQEEDMDDFLDTESIEDGFAAIIKEDTGNHGKKQSTESYEYPENASLSTLKASKERSKKWSSTRKLFSAFTFKFQGMIDTDPEQTRRNQIQKLEEVIKQVNKKNKVKEGNS